MLKKIPIFSLLLILMVVVTLTTTSSTKVRAATLNSGFVSSKYIVINDRLSLLSFGSSSGTVKLDASISALNVMDSSSLSGNIKDSLADGYTVTVLSPVNRFLPPVFQPVLPLFYHIVYLK
ncbi:hypothetical protein [Clostridium estertheticum]|uniref:hypothetical protein n=1 Tax=Clostridium estertheticum TaxID=238834 RepID=UPI001CF4771C|nr:hypothetical protein [Clostridium estertheticum]MCB2356527.1 hypothetical protein [Clostridium estertheticum]WAG43612.1 hypothetical protein LL065_24720 [Clostridium estertheticum]